MVTKEQLVNGIISYVDHEIIPHLPTLGKWGLGTIVCLSTNKINELANTLIDNPLIKALDIVDCSGLIDSDKLINALRMSAEKYGKLDIQIPLLGTMSFTCLDVDKLKTYITPNNTSIGAINGLSAA